MFRFLLILRDYSEISAARHAGTCGLQGNRRQQHVENGCSRRWSPERQVVGDFRRPRIERPRREGRRLQLQRERAGSRIPRVRRADRGKPSRLLPDCDHRSRDHAGRQGPERGRCGQSRNQFDVLAAFQRFVDTGFVEPHWSDRGRIPTPARSKARQIWKICG